MREVIALLPEMFLVITFFGILISELSYTGEKKRLISLIAFIGLFASLIQAVISFKLGSLSLFSQSITLDGFSFFFRLSVIFLAAFTVMATMLSRQIEQTKQSEYFSLVVINTLAVSFLAAATHLIFIFVSMQLLLVSGFFLSHFIKSEAYSTGREQYSIEGMFKHVYFGLFSSLCFLLGTAVLFFYTQSLNLFEIKAYIQQNGLPFTAQLSIFVFYLLSFGVLIGIFPLGLWIPDVMQGAPTIVAGFFVSCMRLGGIAAVFRIFVGVFSLTESETGSWIFSQGKVWTEILILVSVLSMLVGGFSATRQKSLKRLLANLIGVETGFLMVGFLVFDVNGMSGVFYKLVIDIFAILGIYFILANFENLGSNDLLMGVQKFLRKNTLEILSITILLIILIGLPPSPGFVAKFGILRASILKGHYVLSLIAVASFLLSTFAVARLIYHFIGYENFLDKSQKDTSAIAGEKNKGIYTAIIFTPCVLMVFFSNSIIKWMGQSLLNILW